MFWFLSVVFGLRQLIIGAIGLHQVPFLIGIWIDEKAAAAVLGTTAVTSILGRLGFEWLEDRVPKRFVMATAIGMTALGSLILAYVTAWWHLIFFVPIYGIGWGGGATTMSTVCAEYFGRRAFGTISGMMDFVQMFGLVLGPVFAGFVYDTTQSYYIAFMVFDVSGFLAAGGDGVHAVAASEGGPAGGAGCVAPQVGGHASPSRLAPCGDEHDPQALIKAALERHPCVREGLDDLLSTLLDNA